LQILQIHLIEISLLLQTKKETNPSSKEEEKEQKER
jgi:hypothetical protein